MDANGVWHGLIGQHQNRKPRVLVIGAGSRGNAYARAIEDCTDAIIACVAEPIPFQRQQFGKRYIWKNLQPHHGQDFTGWQGFLEYELDRRRRAAAGQNTLEGVDAALICVQDAMHHEVVLSLAPLNLHVMCEKPLSTSLDRCLSIYSSLSPEGPGSSPKSVFGIGHVLRYSPHNVLLRLLLLERKVIGDILSVEHTEPVGWWHFSHSYVRGNWRKESMTAPSLLTKSCHDIDFLLWILTASEDDEPPHQPKLISSMGQLLHFRKSRKPASAGQATNCLSCPIESSCSYSAKSIYLDRHLAKGISDWPVKIIDPEIEDYFNNTGFDAAKSRLLKVLSEDYSTSSAASDIESRPWFGRCVWESDNDVCDDQLVALTWEDESADTTSSSGSKSPPRRTNRFAKTANFHMVAHTEAQCERRGRIYGSKGEISYDSKSIRVYNFASDEVQVHHPAQQGGGHGGGDEGLIKQFILAVDAVKNGKMSVLKAQKIFIGCTLENIIQSHAVVFAAEEARLAKKVVDWQGWWQERVEKRMFERKGWDIVDRAAVESVKSV